MILMPHSKQGFTLIELVVVIIVLGVLAAVAMPKFAQRASFEDYAVRDQLIARLRLVQLQGMNADPSENASDNACYWLVINKDDCFYHEQRPKTAGSCEDPSATSVCDDDSYNQYNSVSFPTGMLNVANYRFGINKGLLLNNAGNAIEGETLIDINGDNDLTIVIEAQGFIHE